MPICKEYEHLATSMYLSTIAFKFAEDEELMRRELDILAEWCER